MADYLSLVNSVLTRLRESKVASVSENDYSLMIGEFVKQALSEMEDAWQWSILRTTIQVVTQDGSFDYGLTDAGTSFQILQVFEDTEDYELVPAPSYQQMNRWLLSNNPDTGEPKYYDLNGKNSSGDPVVNFYPIPDAPYTVNFNMKIKTVLSGDADTISVSELPIILRATQLGVEERGDDGGPGSSSLAQQAEVALNDAIAYDSQEYLNETIWEVY